MNTETALELLKNKGYKYTGKREKIVTMFADETRYMSAREVMEYMQIEYPGLSFDTIYRNLTLFEELGILESTELKGEKQFRFSCPGSDHHHHIICTLCGKTQKIELCPMHAVLGTPDGFTITGHKFEIYGLCDQCES
ncbi:MAG: Fur family transcriptional regulator [Bacilli bacterium]|nr:Fur family transcriptional regulator [Bacilli bacterium]